MPSNPHDPALITLDNLKKHPLPDWSGHASSRASASVLIVAAHSAAPGETLLLARTALRAGAGRVTLAVPGSWALHLGLALPEVQLLALPENALTSERDLAIKLVRESAATHAALVFAPSLDEGDDDLAFVRAASSGVKTATLLGTGVLNPETTQFSPELTPRVYRINATETAWLGAESTPEADTNAPRLQGALSWSDGHQGEAFLVTDSTSVGVFSDGTTTHLPTDTAGLFAPGADEIRSGIIAALLAQGLPPGLAAQWGALFYAEGALAITKDLGEDGFLARDIVDRLPAVHRYFRRQSTTLDKSGFGLRAVK